MRVLLFALKKKLLFKFCPFFSNTSAEGRYVGEPRSVLAWALHARAENYWCLVTCKHKVDKGGTWLLSVLKISLCSQ